MLKGPFLALALLLTIVSTAVAQSSVRFAVIGDYGQEGPDAEAVANLVKSWAPDFIATTGDNNYFFGAASTIDSNIGRYYHAYIHPYKGSFGPGATTNRFFPSMGNHDWEAPGAAPYRAYFTLPGNERYYTVVRGPVQLFILDSDFHEPDGVTDDSVQAAWLQAQLTASTARWKIVIAHHSPFSSGAHGSGLWMQWPFEAWGAHAFLSGHDHTYERVTHGNIPYFVNGLGGAPRYLFGPPIAGSQVRFSDDHGAMRVDATDSQISFRFFTRAGVLVDTYTLYADPSAHRPAAPSGLTAVAISGSEIDLAWVDNASNEAEIVVEQSTDGTTFAPLAILGRDVTHLAAQGFAPLTTYQFRVLARNAAGASDASPAAPATTPIGGPPPPPSGLSARGVTATQIDLAWTDNAPNERAVLVERSDDGNAFMQVASLPPNSRTVPMGGLSPSVAYSFRVRAVNASGASSYSNSVAQRTAAPDLVVTSLTGVPSLLRPGASMSLVSTTANQGSVTARSSLTRFSLVPASGAAIVLSGGASISPLGVGHVVTRTTSIKIPTSVPPGPYQLLACADASLLVIEWSEANNCQPASVTVGLPDLQVVAVGNPPATARRGTKFALSETVRNTGVTASPASKTRYFLTDTGNPGPSLSGSRSVATLAPAQESTGAFNLLVPRTTPVGRYRVLACADGPGTVIESNETNNCAASAGQVQITP
jgi:hypothetical protein